MTDTHIKINAVTPRVQYTGNGVTTVFPYEFAIFDETDMVVYIGDEIQESGYTVSGAGQTDGGEVTFDVAPEDGVVITLYRNIPIERITDFQEGGTFRPKNLNDEFDRQTAFLQQVQEGLGRAVKVNVTSDTDPEEVVPKVEALYDDIDNVDAVAAISEDVETVAQNATAVSTCATNMSAIQDAPTQASNAANSASDASASAASAAISAAGTKFKLFHHDWFDYQLNDLAWLRADTFSWHDGTVYSDAYNHLVDDIEGKTATTETVDGTTITYYLADDGHKIVKVDDVSAIETVYASTGVAWYYVLDTENTRFKLPRENPAREELIQVVRAKGNGVSIGITNGSDTAGVYGYHNGSGQIAAGSTGSYGSNVGTTIATDNTNFSRKTIGITTDSTKSGIISDMTDSTSVYKGKQYLYFYVGQYNQSATEQTAGLNSELFNGKMDLDMSNMNAGSTAKKTIVGWGMPDYSAKISLSYSNFPYTAPSDGIVCINEQTNNGIPTAFVNGISVWSMNANGDFKSCSIAVSKGDIVSMSNTSAIGSTSGFFPLKGV